MNLYSVLNINNGAELLTPCSNRAVENWWDSNPNQGEEYSYTEIEENGNILTTLFVLETARCCAMRI